MDHLTFYFIKIGQVNSELWIFECSQSHEILQNLVVMVQYYVMLLQMVPKTKKFLLSSTYTKQYLD